MDNLFYKQLEEQSKGETKLIFKNIYPKIKIKEYCSYYDDEKQLYNCTASIEIEGTFKQIDDFEKYICRQLDIICPDVKDGEVDGKN